MIWGAVERIIPNKIFISGSSKARNAIPEDTTARNACAWRASASEGLNGMSFFRNDPAVNVDCVYCCFFAGGCATSGTSSVCARFLLLDALRWAVASALASAEAWAQGVWPPIKCAILDSFLERTDPVARQAILVSQLNHLTVGHVRTSVKCRPLCRNRGLRRSSSLQVVDNTRLAVVPPE